MNCSQTPSFEDFSVLCYENRNYVVGLKETQLIMKDSPWIIRNIRFTSSLPAWMGSCHAAPVIVCDQILVVSRNFFDLMRNCKSLIYSNCKSLIYSLWNNLMMNRLDLFETQRQWFFKRNWICCKNLVANCCKLDCRNHGIKADFRSSSRGFASFFDCFIHVFTIVSFGKYSGLCKFWVFREKKKTLYRKAS